MRAETARIYRTLHTWTGIVAGMALFIAFYAGALTVFKEPLTRWATPPVKPGDQAAAAPLAEAQALLTTALASHPALARGFQLHLARTGPATAWLEWEIREDGAGEHDHRPARVFTMVRGAEGAYHAREIARSEIGELIDTLHRVVGLPVDNDHTRYFMGVIAVLYFLAVISGLVTIFPSLVRDLFALRIGPNARRLWRDAHNVVGVASFPFHLVMALTATVFALHDGIYLVQDRLIHGGGLAAMFRGPGEAAQVALRDAATMLPPAALLARVTAVSPGFRPSMLHYLDPLGPKAMVRVWGHDPRALEHRVLGGFAMIDPYTGRLATTAYLPGQQGVAATVLTSLFALHFATYGGAPVKWMYFGLGLLGAWLFFSGNLLWLETRRRRAGSAAAGRLPAQQRSARLLASATVGVCLGAVCGLSLAVVSAKWLHGCSPARGAWQPAIYYAAFFAALAWSFWRGAARAAVALLRIAAAATLAIPLTTLVAVAWPSLGMWAHTAPGPLGVDLTAFAMGLGYAWMARRVSRRVLDGPPDSVWSAAVVGREPLPSQDEEVTRMRRAQNGAVPSRPDNRPVIEEEP